MANVNQPDRREVQNGSGLGTVTKIVSLNDSVDAVSESELAAVIKYLEQDRGVDGAGDSSFSVVGITGFGGQTVHLALQGSGTLTVGDADLGVTNHTVAEVCTFTSSS